MNTGGIEMHGGKIIIESTYGEGSNFIIKLPVITVDETKEKTEYSIIPNYVDKMNIEFSDIYAYSY